MNKIEVPEGFVEFAMQMMKRAVELRANDQAPKRVLMILDTEQYNDDASQIDDVNECIEASARACLVAVEPPTIDVTANGKDK